MTKMKAVEAVGKLVGILEPLAAEDRIRAIHAALALFGENEDVELEAGGASRQLTPPSLRIGEKAYFDEKKPRTKGEELAVAARYREERANAAASTQAELEAVTKAARRNFDSNNFRRDVENARVKGMFNRGTGKDAVVLSHYGQSYVDALPDRDALKALSKPKGAGKRRKRAKKGVKRRSRQG